MTVAHMDEGRLLERIGALTGATPPEARRIGQVVTSVLLEQVPAEDCLWVAKQLPEQWAPEPAYVHAQGLAHDALSEFYARVAAREGVEPGFAREHAQSACRALAEALDDDTRRHLTSRLPDELAPLFERTPRSSARPQVGHSGARKRTTLSEGRPGSRKPLAAAAPERAQQDSVTRSDNPHADTKLSSSSGTTQEREGETLARGHEKH
jgi:uncharacterized protein (DUF2267 family)